MATLATAATAISAIASTAGTIVSGISAANNAKFEEQQAEQRANEERAIMSRETARAKREKDLLTSSQLAASAASGGGTANQTVTGMLARAEQTGKQNIGQVIFEGESRARGFEDLAAVKRAEARSARIGTAIGAVGTLASGVSRFGGNYRRRPRPSYGGSTYRPVY